MITFKKPTILDIDSMQKVVKPYIESGIILNRSEDDVANTIRSYTLALKDDKIIGFGALHIYSKTLAEIRSLVVKDGFQKKGIGKQILQNLIAAPFERYSSFTPNLPLAT